MRLTDMFESMADDREHWDALERTGFFGNQGAGCIFLARDTGRLLLAHRSRHVEQPGSWGGWGGAINRGENPEEAVRREVAEEAGHTEHLSLIPLFVFKAIKNGKEVFRYHNFLAVVDHEFKPKLDWETQGYRWCKFGEWPQPLHFGLVELFNDPKSVETIRAEVAE